MKHFTSRPLSVALIAVTLTWLFPLRQVAADQGATDRATPEPLAVVLGPEGTLSGVAMAAGGRPEAGAVVVLGRDGKPLRKVATDKEGVFEFAGLTPGDYQLATRSAGAFLRCVEAADAPDGAVPRVVLSREAMVARGQNPASMLLHPLLVGLVIAAAIAIPVAIHNSDDDDGS